MKVSGRVKSQDLPREGGWGRERGLFPEFGDGLRLAVGLLAAVEFTVVTEPVAEAAEQVCVFGGDAAAEVENDVPQLVDLTEIGIHEFSHRIKYGLEDTPIILATNH